MQPMLATVMTETALPVMCRRLGVRRLELFGSAVEDRFDPARSDLDFLVEFEPGRGDFSTYFDLKEGLAGMFGQPVDLLMAGTIRNPYRRRSIEAQRRQVFPLT